MPIHKLEQRLRLTARLLGVVTLMILSAPQSGFGQAPIVLDLSKAAANRKATAEEAAAVQGSNAQPETAVPQSKRENVSRAQRQRIALRRETSQRVSAQLVAASRSAFVRGLLPVEDYAERLNGARELELAALDAEDHAARATVMRRHTEIWTAAVERLRQFRQPASGGWAADLSYAQMMQATARSYFAEETGNRAEGRAAMIERAAFAQQQFDRRLVDLDMGLASLAQVAESLSQLRQTAGSVESSVLSAPAQARLDNRLELAGTEINARVERLQEQPAGISRRDALQRIEYELEMTAADESARSEQETAVAARATDAYRAAAQMSATEERVYREGRTAALSDLSRSWRLRRDAVARLQPDEDKPRVTEFDAEMKKSLEQLMSLAGTIRDRRGRNQADVLFVRSLNVLADWQADRVAAATPLPTNRVQR